MFGAIFAASQSSNPILPATGEIIWSLASFLVLIVILAKVAFPPVKRIMVARTEKIRDDLDGAALARAEAERLVHEKEVQLEDAKRQATRIIEDAKVTAEAVREDLIRRAGVEVEELKARAEEALLAERERVVAELRSEVSGLAIDVAEKILRSELDRSEIDPLVGGFLSDLAAGKT